MNTVPATTKSDETRTGRVIIEASIRYEPAEQTIKLPAASQVVGVYHAHDGIKLIVTCNPNLPDTERTFCLRRSGELLPEPAAYYRYVGTLHETPAVHIFEKRA